MKTLTKEMQNAITPNMALDILKEGFGSWETPWGEFNRYQRIDGEIFQDRAGARVAR